ncbi:MAG: flagellar basal body L-ring protein FlgH [Panacagrimonas sp.]
MSAHLQARAVALLGVVLAGCASAPKPLPDPPQPLQRPSFVREANPGSIYNAGSSFVLFEDPKARVQGDLLTVLLIEKTQAQKKASTSTSKTSKVGIENPTIAGLPLSDKGVGVGSFSLEGSRGFDGQGDTSQSNQLNGSITVTVVERLPNGNLVVSGEKNLELNQGSERVRLSGIVRPVDIRPDNSITSDRIADARIQYVGRGALADANAQGWFSRFFNSPWFPF